MSFRLRLRRAVLRLLGYYVAPTERERLLSVVGRTRIDHIRRESRIVGVRN